MPRFQIYARDKTDITTLEMPILGAIDTHTDFKAVNRHNDVGSWSLTMPAGVEQTSLIAPGRGIVVFREGEQNFPVFSGPIRQIDRSWSSDAAGAGTVVVSGPCDNVILKERLGRITPTEDWPYEGHAIETTSGDLGKPAWVPNVHDVGGVSRPPNNSGEFIYALLVDNFTVRTFNGDWDMSRTVLQLDLDDYPWAALKSLPNDDLWKGFPISLETDLTSEVFALAEAAGLSVSFQWQTHSKTDPANTSRNKLYVSITPIADKSSSVVFDPSAGNLTSYTLSSVAPDATRVVIGGQVTDGGRRWYSLRKDDFFDPPGWIDRDDRDEIGNRYSPTSDGAWGRQKIEIDWNTSAEMFLDDRNIAWEFQVGPDDRTASISPVPGSDIAVQVDQDATKALVENGPKGLLTMTAVDSPSCAYGVDYFVSDVVRVLIDNTFLPESMRPEDGVLREMVREVSLSSTASEVWKVSPTVGTADSSATPYIYRQLAKLRWKVDEATNRTTNNALSTARPNAPSIGIAPSGYTTGTGNFCYTTRPLPGQQYQVFCAPLGDSTEPGWVARDSSELQVDVRNGETGDWVRQTSTAPYPADGRFWYTTVTMTGNVNDEQYVRARISASGSVSDWGKSGLLLTAAPGAINTNGTVSLNTPPAPHHLNQLLIITGTDTTNAQLTMQIDTGSGYTNLNTRPRYVGSSFSLTHLVSDTLPSTYSIRVVSSSQNGYNGDIGTIYKTSNVVTINVV